MRKPATARNRTPRSSMVFEVESLPPPIGGWNRRDSLPLMEKTDAIMLDNWIPDTTALRLRGGYSVHTTVEATATAIETLINYPALNGSNAKFFAATPSAIYDVTTAIASTGNDSYTKLLMHFNGSDASTTFTDSNLGGTVKTFTASGNAQIDTAQSKFGGASGLFDGTGDYISASDHADFTFGSGDFTVDFWFRCNDAGGAAVQLFGQMDNAGTTSTRTVEVLKTAANVIQFNAYVGGFGFTVTGTTQFTNALNTGWHHLAAIRYSNVLYLYIDGTSEGTPAAIAGTVQDSSNAFAIGRPGEVNGFYWNGWFDEFRLSIGVARWTTTFTPPTSAYGGSASVFTGLSNGRWQHDYMANTSGLYTVAVNGANAPLMYDGSTWATCSVSASGLTRTNLIHVHNHMNRLWFLEENQLHAWYLDVSSIQGTLTKFLPPFRRGGKAMAMGSWTRDGGSGPDDYSVFVSSNGECIIYSGTDPSSSTTSALVGVYNIPPVIGRRCLVPAGAELGVLTMQGLVPLSQILGMSPGAAARTAITDKISGQFRSQFFTSGTTFGWQAVEYPRGNLLIVNVPITERTTQHQYVMNEITGAWTRFTGVNAGCWATFGNDIYYGGNDGKVYKYEGATSDNGANIIGTVQHAYDALGNPLSKRFTMARAIFNAPSIYNPPITIQTDYDLSVPDVTILQASTTGTQWDAAQWDSFQWAGGSVVTLGWQPTMGEGRSCSPTFSVSSSEPIYYNGVDIGFERGHRL